MSVYITGLDINTIALNEYVCQLGRNKATYNLLAGEEHNTACNGHIKAREVL